MAAIRLALILAIVGAGSGSGPHKLAQIPAPGLARLTGETRGGNRCLGSGPATQATLAACGETPVWVGARGGAEWSRWPGGACGCAPSGLRLRGGAGLEDTLRDVRMALEVLHDPLQSNENRQRAQALCDGVKERVGRGDDMRVWGDSMMICKRLVDTEMSETVRHFGYQLLQHLSTKVWGSLAEDCREDLKRTAVGLLVGGTKGMLEERRFIKEKAAQVVTRLMAHDWPARWPRLTSQIRSLILQGGTPGELALIALRALPDEIFGEGVGAARRNDLLAALHAELPQLLGLLAQVLAQEAAEPGGEERRLTVEALCGCFEAYGNVAPVKVTCESGAPAVLHALLPDHALRLKAADALLAVVGKKTREAHAQMCELAGLLVGTVGSMGVGTEPEHYRFCRRLVQVTCELAVCHPGAIAAHPPTAQAVAQLMLALVAYPCAKIPAATLPYWGGLVEAQRNARGKEGGGDGGFGLTEELQAALIDAWRPRMGKGVMTELDEMDFVDEEEFGVAYAGIQARFLDILRKITAERPRETLLQVGGMWQSALLAEGQLQTKAHGGTAVSLGHLEGLHRMLEHTVESIPPQCLGEGTEDEAPHDAETRAHCNALCTEIVRTLLGCAGDPNPELRVLVIRAVGFFTVFFQQSEPEMLPVLVQRLLALFTQFQDSPEAARNTRRATSGVLLKIGGACAYKLAPHIQALVSLVQGVSAQVPGDEAARLTELLFLVSTGLESPRDRHAFLDFLLSGLSQSWATHPVGDLPGGLLKSLFGATTISEDAALEARRLAVLSTLQTLTSLLRRVNTAEGGGTGDEAPRPFAAALGAHVRQLLVPLLALVQSLHALWLPHVRGAVGPRWAGVFLPVELKGALDPNYKPSAADCGDPKVTEACAWLRQCRDASYEALAHLCEGAGVGLLYDIAAADGGVLEAVGSHWGCMENRHLRQILRAFLSPFIRKCPAKYHEVLLRPLLSPLFLEILARLQRGYGAVERGEALGGGGEKEEVLEDTALHLLHREGLDLLLSICSSAVENTMLLEGGGFSSSDGVGDIAGFLLGCDGASSAAIQILTESLRWKDSVACTKAVEISQRLLVADPSRLAEQDRAAVCGVMLGCALRSLGSSECRENLEALITDIYVAFGGGASWGSVHQELSAALGTSLQEAEALQQYMFAEGRKEKERRMRMRQELARLSKPARA